MGLAPYENAIATVATMFGKIADAFKTSKEKQLETEFIKEDKNEDKAIKIANQAFDLIDSNNGYLPPDVNKQFAKLKKQFDKNIK